MKTVTLKKIQFLEKGLTISFETLPQQEDVAIIENLCNAEKKGSIVTFTQDEYSFKAPQSYPVLTIHNRYFHTPAGDFNYKVRKDWSKATQLNEWLLN